MKNNNNNIIIVNESLRGIKEYYYYSSLLITLSSSVGTRLEQVDDVQGFAHRGRFGRHTRNDNKGIALLFPPIAATAPRVAGRRRRVITGSRYHDNFY